MKRIVLFLVTNLAIMLVLSVTLSVLGVDKFLSANGLNVGMLLVFSLIVGFGGSFISLLMSKPIAKWTTGAQVIDGSEGAEQRWLVDTVHRLAERAGIGMPEVAYYEGEPNAFATGAFRDSALVAVSTGLLQSMTREEVGEKARDLCAPILGKKRAVQLVDAIWNLDKLADVRKLRPLLQA